MTEENFSQRFSELASARSPLCLGLDPSREVFSHWGLEQNAEGLARFLDVVLEATDSRMAVYKPQLGFFERFGVEGLRQLSDCARRIRAGGSLLLLDGKRGDIASTMEGYASAIFREGGGLEADAATFTAYLGFADLRPVIEAARDSGRAAFVVVHSSNPGGRAVQGARMEDGRTLAEHLADSIEAELADGKGCVGAVVGATIPDAAVSLVERMPGALILCPGVGSQGASIKDVARKFRSARGRVIPTVSRGALMAGPDVKALRAAIRDFQDQAFEMNRLVRPL